MLIPYGIQAYRRAELPRIVLRNMFVEAVPTSTSKVALMSRPGLNFLYKRGDGPVRGILFQSGAFDNSVFVVSGNELYRDDTLLGSIGGSTSVQGAVTDRRALFATGEALYATGGATVGQVAFPDDAGVASVVYLGGLAIAARTNTRRIYFTQDPDVWDGLDYLSAEQSTDSIIGLAVVVDQLWVFCRRHTEIFFLTGDADAPLQRVQGRVFDKGALSRDSIVKMDNTVFWVGHDEIVYRAENTPIRISDHGIEQRIAESEREVYAFSYISSGHLFYVLQLKNETVAFDVATKQWHELGTGPEKWTPLTSAYVNRPLVGDAQGRIFFLDENTYDDNGLPIERVFTIMLDTPGIVDNLSFDCSAGAEGSIDIRTSRDEGATWSNWRATPLTADGRKRVRFNRLGLVDEAGMIVQVRITGAISASVRSVRVNESGGGRSRA